MANLASYAQHDSVVTATIEAGRADKELWNRIADKCRSDRRMNGKGKFLVDVAMDELYLTTSCISFDAFAWKLTPAYSLAAAS